MPSEQIDAALKLYTKSGDWTPVRRSVCSELLDVFLSGKEATEAMALVDFLNDEGLGKRRSEYDRGIRWGWSKSRVHRFIKRYETSLKVNNSEPTPNQSEPKGGENGGENAPFEPTPNQSEPKPNHGDIYTARAERERKEINTPPSNAREAETGISESKDLWQPPSQEEVTEFGAVTGIGPGTCEKFYLWHESVPGRWEAAHNWQVVLRLWNVRDREKAFKERDNSKTQTFGTSGRAGKKAHRGGRF